MYTITILRSSPKSQTSFKDMLDPKWAGTKFLQTVNPNFPIEDHKNSFYTKKSSKFNESLRRYKLKCWFQAKKGKFGPKKDPKWAGLDFLRTVNINFPKEDFKISFYTNKYAQRWSPATTKLKIDQSNKYLRISKF